VTVITRCSIGVPGGEVVHSAAMLFEPTWLHSDFAALEEKDNEHHHE